MAKEQEKNLAFFYYTKDNMEAKDIATKLKVRPNTVGDWIKKGNWKKIRDANINQSGERLDRIQQVVDDLATERLDIMKMVKDIPEKIRALEKDIREIPNKETTDPMKAEVSELKEEMKNLKRQTVYIDQGIAMWNKTLASFQAENKVTLTKYIEIMDKIFGDMRTKDEKLYMQTLDFQHAHLLETSTQLS
jgi:transposase